jgi:hypothetical protein
MNFFVDKYERPSKCCFPQESILQGLSFETRSAMPQVDPDDKEPTEEN